MCQSLFIIAIYFIINNLYYCNSFRNYNIKYSNNKMKTSITTNHENRLDISSILLQRGKVGQIQGNRLHLHNINAKRKIYDFFIWSHIFLGFTSYTAYINKNLELGFLMGITTILSTLYHYTYEKPSKLAKLEGLSAKLLFIYGACQTIIKGVYLPLPILLTELALLFTTLTFFLITNIYPELYDKWHSFGLHVIPAIWAFIVAINHKPFLV